MATNSLGYQTGRNPIAQSFYVDEPTGIYVTKIDLYFKSRYNPSGVSRPQVNLQLRPMRNGFPSITEIIPGSNIYLDAAYVNTSTDASVATSFEFEEPVYLEGLRDFAIILNSPVPEYEVYISEIDSIIIGSNSLRVNKNPSLGSLFYTQNGATFTANQKQDLKFDLYRAKFLYNDGQVILHNAKLPRHVLNSDYGIRVRAGSSEVDIYIPGHGLNVNDTIGISGVTSTISGIAPAAINGDHTITAVDNLYFRFDCGTVATADAVAGDDRVLVTRNYPYQGVYPFLQIMNPPTTDFIPGLKTCFGKSIAGTETPYTKQSDYNVVTIEKTGYDVNATHVVMADSIESVELGGGQKSLDMLVTLISNNDIVAPMIDLQRSSVSLINNIIDKQDSASSTGFNIPLQYSSEETPTGGSSPSKHVTRVVKLNEKAVGLKVLIGANVPTEADFLLYYRTAKADEDLSTYSFIEKSPEVAMPKDNIKNVFREYEYLIGGQGGNMDPFDQYQIKIVMRSTNQAKVPVFKDLRTIALAT